MKIWKPTLESLLNEAFAPVYLQLFSVRRNMNLGGGSLPMVAWYISAAGWNDEERLVEWRAQVTPEMPATAPDLPELREAQEKALQVKQRILGILSSKEIETREGSVSDEAVLGDLSEELL